MDDCLGYSLFCVDARVAIQSHKHFWQFDTVLVLIIHWLCMSVRFFKAGMSAQGASK